MSDVGCSLEVALAWCLSAKNVLLNSYGYGPNQLVFSYNPKFLSISENKLPALEGATSSELLASRLNALHSAKTRLIETEADEKLCRALKYKTRTATSLKYQTRDKVCYKRKDSNYWKGPRAVIGYDNKQVFVRHGGKYNQVSPCNLQLVNKVEEDLSKSDDHQTCSDMIDLQKESKVNEADEDSGADDVMLDLQKRENKEKISEEHKENDVDELANKINQIDLHIGNSDYDNPTKKITHMWSRWGTPQNFFLAFIHD